MRIIERTQSSCVNVRSRAERSWGGGGGGVWFLSSLKKEKEKRRGGEGGLYSLA